MIRGLYSSATAMLALMYEQEVIANNLANANTTGFKQDYATINSFHDALVYESKIQGSLGGSQAPIGQISTAVGIGERGIINKDGELKQTGESLDLALSGEGFFAIQGPAGEVYTRAGSFKKNGSGILVDQSGHPVLGQKGPIKVSGKKITIEKAGEVYVDGKYIDTLKIMRFSKGGLVKVENNVLVARSEGSLDKNTKVRQGYLEASNVDVPKETVNMMITSSSYEANQRVLKVQDELLGRLINDVGRYA